MKKILVIPVLVFTFFSPSFAQSPFGPGLQHNDLRVVKLEMNPDPVSPGQEVRFRARLRNDGVPLRANIRIQDQDQVVVQLNDVFLTRGHSEYLFPYTRYQFQRFDHCFTVIVDVKGHPIGWMPQGNFVRGPLVGH